MNENIYTEAKRLNIPLDHHESDLYLMVTDESTKLVTKYDKYKNAKTFISQIDGKLWYDLPFMYIPFWNKLNK